MSSVVINDRQSLFGSLAKAGVEAKPTPMILRTAHEPSDMEQPPPPGVLAMPSAKPAAWDPHEVWLNRVKMPREQQSS